jgi:hypothetical protein
MYLEVGLDNVPGAWAGPYGPCTWRLGCTWSLGWTLYLEPGLDPVPGAWAGPCTLTLVWTLYLEPGQDPVCEVKRVGNANEGEAGGGEGGPLEHRVEHVLVLTLQLVNLVQN